MLGRLDITYNTINPAKYSGTWGTAAMSILHKKIQISSGLMTALIWTPYSACVCLLGYLDLGYQMLQIGQEIWQLVTWSISIMENGRDKWSYLHIANTHVSA